LRQCLSSERALPFRDVAGAPHRRNPSWSPSRRPGNRVGARDERSVRITRHTTKARWSPHSVDAKSSTATAPRSWSNLVRALERVPQAAFSPPVPTSRCREEALAAVRSARTNRSRVCDQASRSSGNRPDQSDNTPSRARHELLPRTRPPAGGMPTVPLREAA